MAVVAALIRGLTRRDTDRLGNFWVDLTRISLRVLLPLSILAAMVLVVSGVIQNLNPPTDITTIAGGTPDAAGWAGRLPGGDQGARHQRRRLLQRQLRAPVREPERVHQPVRDLPAAGDSVLPAPHLRAHGGQRQAGARDPGRDGGALGRRPDGDASLVENAHPGAALQAAGAATEGKEVRFGIPLSALFAVSTTATSTGAVDSMHSSYTGLGGGVLLLNMLLGEISPGGTGSGLYGMLILAIITVFVAGLMVGRTPTYPGQADRRHAR